MVSIITVLKGCLPSTISAQAASSSSQERMGAWKTSRAFSPGSVARNSAPSVCAQVLDFPILVCPYHNTVRSARSGLGGVLAVGSIDMMFGFLLLESELSGIVGQHPQLFV